MIHGASRTATSVRDRTGTTTSIPTGATTRPAGTARIRISRAGSDPAAVCVVEWPDAGWSSRRFRLEDQGRNDRANRARTSRAGKRCDSFPYFRCNLPAAGMPAAANAAGGPRGGCIPRRPPGRERAGYAFFPFFPWHAGADSLSAAPRGAGETGDYRPADPARSAPAIAPSGGCR